MFKKLFKQTFIYGLATVLPRMFTFILIPLYTHVLPVSFFGEVSVIFSWIALFNVLLAYGMETAFFRFYTQETNKQNVLSTSLLSVAITSFLFLLLGLTFKGQITSITSFSNENITYTIWILVLDALVFIPFSKLRVDQKPMYYAVIKVLNVVINLSLNLLFLVGLPMLISNGSNTFWDVIYVPNFQIEYIFISNLIASLITFIILLPQYFKAKWNFDLSLWRKMQRYGLPILVAGIAFAINETFDRILLEKMLPSDESLLAVGAYSACYKLALFMTLFATAFRLGVEPFFFSQAKEKNATETYALITKYYVIFGSVILLSVIVFSDLLKILLIRNEAYWIAMEVVPLIIIANLFLGIYHNLSVWYKLTDKTLMGAYISIVGALITLVVNILLIPVIGLFASAIATVSAYGTMMVVSYLLSRRYYPIPYELKTILKYLSLSIIFSIVSFYFFRDNLGIGITLLFLFVYFVFRNEKELFLRILKHKK